MKTSHRENLLAAFSGEATDFIPVAPNFDFWYRARTNEDSMPAQLKGLDHDDVLTKLGYALCKGAPVASRRFREPIEFKTWREDDLTYELWKTPKGDLRRVSRQSAYDRSLGMAPQRIEYPVKDFSDYPAYIELMKHLEFTPDPDFSKFHEKEAALGENGLAYVPLSKSPGHDFMMKWTGYENAFYHMADNKALFSEAIQTANDAYRPLWDILAASPCRLIVHGGNYSTAMTPPPVFKEYILPYFKEFNTRMKDAGKLVGAHTDGDMTGLLDLYLEAGFSTTNCHACAPLVNCTLEEAADKWLNKVSIWGAVPSILFEPTATDDEFYSHLEKMLALARKGSRFIAAISDHAMPASRYERLVGMGNFFRENRI